jgi:hypothetical protein
VLTAVCSGALFLKDLSLWLQVRILLAALISCFLSSLYMFCVAAQHRVFVLDSVGKRMHAMQPDNGTIAVHLLCFC